MYDLLIILSFLVIGAILVALMIAVVKMAKSNLFKRHYGETEEELYLGPVTDEEIFEALEMWIDENESERGTENE